MATVGNNHHRGVENLRELWENNPAITARPSDPSKPPPKPPKPLKLANGTKINQVKDDKTRRSRLHYFSKLVQSILLRPVVTTTTLAFRTVKLLTWVPAKSGLQKISGFHQESAAYFEREYLKTVKAVRDILFIPSVVKRAFVDMVATREEFVDDIRQTPTADYLKVGHNKTFLQYSSYLHGLETFDVIVPQGITEFAAASDASLKTIMASHIFKPDMMAINFGCPNVAAFVTEEGENGSVQTMKVDAKSLRRAPMSYHPTNGKIQSGVFLVPTNLPEEALNRFKEAAKAMQERKDITCVNTNCRVLKEAGFSIEGVEMDEVIFPTTLFEHLLYRNTFYTDSEGTKHKVHFDILNTTQQNLEEYFETVDTAVVGTRLRHRRRNKDTEENQQIRSLAAKALIEEEAKRLEENKDVPKVYDEDLGRRKVSVSVPSCLGNAIARVWGRHTIYEVDLSDRQKEISEAFEALAQKSEQVETAKLRPFPQERPSFVTRLKRDIFFAGPMIRFLRRHIMGRVDAIHLHTQDLFKHLKSTEGEHLNYVLLDDKVVFSRVHANHDSKQVHRKTADWALSKHALLADRKEVYCSGEIWYDKARDCFVMNDDSGTYKPSLERVKIVADLANKIFDTQRFGNTFYAESANEEIVQVA